MYPAAEHSALWGAAWQLVTHVPCKAEVCDLIDPIFSGHCVGGRLSSGWLSNPRTVVLGAGGEVRGQGEWDVILSVNMELKS